MALDDGKTVLVTAWTGSLSSSRIVAVSLENGHTSDLGLPGSSPLGVIDGNLIYANAVGALMAVPFDERRIRITAGSAALVLDSVSIVFTGASKAALSASGSLGYQTGGGAQQIVLADARGAMTAPRKSPARRPASEKATPLSPRRNPEYANTSRKTRMTTSR